MLCVCVGDVMDVVFFCLYCQAWSCRMIVYGKCECFRHADVVSCVYPVAVLNAAFCMTCSLLMLIADAIGRPYRRGILQSRSHNCFTGSYECPHPVAVSAFMICRGLLCVYWKMVWMCVLYVSFGSKIRPRTFVCVVMGSALLFIVRSRLLVYSAGSGVNRVQVVLSGFSKRLFCFVRQKLYVGMVVCILGCTRTCVCGCDCDVVCRRP